MDKRAPHPLALLLHEWAEGAPFAPGFVFVAPALLQVMKEGLVFVASATPAGDLDKGLLWLNAECSNCGK